MAATVKSRSELWTMCAAVLALAPLAGCSKFEAGQDRMAWARAALERNPQLEIIASDPQSTTFTVRLKSSGDLQIVRADQLVAAPGTVGGTASLDTATSAAAAATQSATAAPSDAATAAVAAPAVAPAAGAATAAASRPTGAPATSPAGAQATAPSVASDASDNDAQATRPTSPAPAAGDQAVAAAGDQATASGVPRAQPASGASPGHVLASGPGYTIKAAEGRNGRRATVASGSGSTASVERRHDPIVCQGNRFLQIDNRNLEFDGDAVSAQDGCEIHITNSRITAKGVGVSARKANVHIENSQIEGDSGSVDASEGAQVFAASSTFKGLRRRLDDATFHDLGGNVWN